MSVILIRLYFSIPLTLVLTLGLSLSLLTRGDVTPTNLIALCVKGLCVHYFEHSLRAFLQLFLIPLALFGLVHR